MPPTLSAEAEESVSMVSPLILGGLLYGIGVLDAEEVLRYMDETFRRQGMVQGEKQHE